MILYGKNKLFKTLMPEDDENIGALLEFAEKYALKGNLIKAKIAWLIMMDENPFSLSIERSGVSGSAEVYAKRDLTELRDLFFISPKDDILGCYLPQNTRVSGEEARIGELISDFAAKLEEAADDEAFFAEVKSFYGKYGVGDFGMNKAFYMLDDGRLVPHPRHFLRPYLRLRDPEAEAYRKHRLLRFGRRSQQRSSLRRQRYGKIHRDKSYFKYVLRQGYSYDTDTKASVRTSLYPYRAA